MIQTVDNYFSFGNDTDKYYCNIGKINKNQQKIIGDRFEFTFKDYLSKSKNNTFFSFFKDQDKQALKNSEDDLIISITKNSEGNYIAQTGNYVGSFYIDKLKVEIKSRFSQYFLKRMLNFANDVYLDDVDIAGDKSNKELDISKFIIYYMFVQNLEKAFLLGMPKSYQSIQHHDIKLKGTIDINKFIKNDIPFKGKISSVSREQREVQEIINVLHKAVNTIETNGFNTKNISHIKTHLKQQRSQNYVSNQTLQKAMNAKALQNPIFAPYKKVLKYAKYIIDGSNLEQKESGKEQTFGFLINVAELFEIYVTKLLQKEFNEWQINSPKIELYEKQFFARKIIPDIVMQKENKILVFDTKYKKMTFKNRYQNGGDLDRNDFFQINTYMSYYQNSGYEVIAGGLLYPMEGKFNENVCYAESWFENNKTKFLVDGLELSSLNNENISDREQNFIGRIKKLIP